jgi:hypothetical protein
MIAEIINAFSMILRHPVIRIWRQFKFVYYMIRDLECFLCDYTLAVPTHLKSYVKAVHAKINESKYTWWNNTASRKQILLEHVKSVHEK